MLEQATLKVMRSKSLWGLLTVRFVLAFGLLSTSLIYISPSSALQSDSSDQAASLVEKIHTKEESEEIISVLDNDYTRLNRDLFSAEKRFESRQEAIELIKQELAKKEIEAVEPIVESYVFGSTNKVLSSQEQYDRVRSKYLGGVAAEYNSQAIEGLEKLRKESNLAEAELDAVESRKVSIQNEIEVIEYYLAEEKTYLGKISERTIHERGMDGTIKAVNNIQNRGRKAGFRLDTCPINGAHDYADSFGAPRSGGRKHQGADLMANTGVEIVAPVSGRVEHGYSAGLAGNYFRLFDENGNYHYGSHMSAFGEKGQVQAGDVIGYVGKTGNARYTPPHLHYEIHPGGRNAPAINPTTDLRAVCSGYNGQIYR